MLTVYILNEAHPCMAAEKVLAQCYHVKTKTDKFQRAGPAPKTKKPVLFDATPCKTCPELGPLLN